MTRWLPAAMLALCLAVPGAWAAGTQAPAQAQAASTAPVWRIVPEKSSLSFVRLFPFDQGNCLLQNEVVWVSDQFPICGSQVQVKGFNVLNDGFYWKVFVMDLDLVSDLIREGEKENNTRGDIAQDGPDGEKGNS